MIRIPAIDIIEGKVVRLTQGDFDKKTFYKDDLVTLAKKFEDAGATRLHLVDLDGARGLTDNRKAIYQIPQKTNLQVQLGGGIRSAAVLDQCLEQGISACIIGSLAVKDKGKVGAWLQKYDAEQLIIGADIRDHFIATDGWLSTSKVNIQDFIQYYLSQGARQFLCTDIAQDGTLAGPAVPLYTELLKIFPDVQFIASGGVSSLQDLDELESIGVSSVVIGKALLEGKIDLNKLYL